MKELGPHRHWADRTHIPRPAPLRWRPQAAQAVVGPTPVLGLCMGFLKALLVLLGVGLLMGCSAQMQQCDSVNALSSNCYQKQGPPYRN